jgi:hypothetical protein
MGRSLCLGVSLLVSLAIAGCGDDDGASEAERRGIGAGCVSDDECSEAGQRCLTFKGGYCGLSDCTTNEDCPSGSACVAHDDGDTYCFLVCRDKPECNDHRPLESQSNCSSNITFTDASTAGVKACVPPS